MTEDEEIDALYAAPLASFIDQRKAAAARLRAGGDKAGATRLLAIAKPTPAAWAVNRLFCTQREAFDALLDTGDTLRRALRESFAGRGRPGEAAQLQKEQREAVAALVAFAASQLATAGAPGGQPVLDRVATSLRTISTTGAWGGAAPGRLARELGEADLASIAALLVDDSVPRVARAKPSAQPDRSVRSKEKEAASSHERPARKGARPDAGDGPPRGEAKPHASSERAPAASGKPAVSRAEAAERARTREKAGAAVKAATADERAARAAVDEARRAAEAAASQRTEGQRRADEARAKAAALHEAAEEATRIAKEALLAVKRESDAVVALERAEVAAGRALRSAGIAADRAEQQLAAARAAYEDATRD